MTLKMLFKAHLNMILKVDLYVQDLGPERA